MRTLVYTGFMSLDGVVDSPGGGPGEEHRSGGWVVNDLEFVPEAWSLKGEELTGTTALMFGRHSYEAFAAVSARYGKEVAQTLFIDNPGQIIQGLFVSNERIATRSGRKWWQFRGNGD